MFDMKFLSMQAEYFGITHVYLFIKLKNSNLVTVESWLYYLMSLSSLLLQVIFAACSSIGLDSILLSWSAVISAATLTISCCVICLLSKTVAEGEYDIQGFKCECSLVKSSTKSIPETHWLVPIISSSPFSFGPIIVSSDFLFRPKVPLQLVLWLAARYDVLHHNRGRQLTWKPGTFPFMRFI